MGRHQPHLLVAVPESSDVVPVSDDARRHLEKVLRITSAAPVTYTDGKGLYGSGSYEDGVIHRGEEKQRSRSSLLTVAVAPPRDNARARFLVEKLTELGVARLLWLVTAHAEGRAPRPEKVSSWVRSALEQSRGAWLMEIAGSIPVADVATMGTPVFAQLGGGSASNIPRREDLVLCVGPEGGFASDEIPATALHLGLGDNILRVETAAIVGAAFLIHAAK